MAADVSGSYFGSNAHVSKKLFVIQGFIGTCVIGLASIPNAGTHLPGPRGSSEVRPARTAQWPGSGAAPLFGPAAPWLRSSQIDRTDIETFLRRSKRFAAREEGRLVPFVAVRVEGHAPLPVTREVPQAAKMRRHRIPILVGVDIAELATEPDIDPIEAAAIMLVRMRKDSSPCFLLKRRRYPTTPTVWSEHPDFATTSHSSPAERTELKPRPPRTPG
jgi:hypothetical protein